MDYSFPRYLLSKQTVDDRALNKDVLQALRLQLPPEPLSVIEVGAGIGTMLKRLVEWNVLCAGEYVLVDEQAENIAYARQWIPHWAADAGIGVERNGEQIHLCDQSREIHVRLECTDVFDFMRQNARPADLLVAHAFLDLLPMPESLPGLLSLTKGLAWLTVNFDGISTLQPAIEPDLDEKIERLYHASMDHRATGGDSRTGRRLFEHLRQVERAEIVAAGASDWVVFAGDGNYPADEKYFLQFILHFFESSLQDCADLPAADLARWLAERHAQIERGELVYIAHQMDLLVRKRP